MTYTPRMLVAWMDIHSRVEAADKADLVALMSHASNPGKGSKAMLKKLRELL